MNCAMCSFKFGPLSNAASLTTTLQRPLPALSLAPLDTYHLLTSFTVEVKKSRMSAICLTYSQPSMFMSDDAGRKFMCVLRARPLSASSRAMA